MNYSLRNIINLKSTFLTICNALIMGFAHAKQPTPPHNCLPEQRTLAQIQAIESQHGVLDSETTQIFVPLSTPPRAVAVVLHGLNNKASSTNEIARDLAKGGIIAVRGGLSGHRGDIKNLRIVNRTTWLQDVHNSWCLAEELARPENLPIVAVGFSLGALMLSDLSSTSEYEGVKFSRAVFYAPAISVRFHTFLLRLLSPFPGIVIPSANLLELRASPSGTPISAYNALFDSINSVERFGLSKLPFPTYVFMDPKDELVSDSGMKELVASRPGKDWQLHEVRAGPDTTLRASHHAIFESRLIGKTAWTDMMNKSVEFLLQGLPPRAK